MRWRVCQQAYILYTFVGLSRTYLIQLLLPMTHAPQRKYRHRDLILGLSSIALLLFIVIQVAYYALASHPRWLFVGSFSAPNLVAFLIAPRITMRRGLQTGIVLAGIIGVSFVGMALIGLLFLYFGG